MIEKILFSMSHRHRHRNTKELFDNENLCILKISLHSSTRISIFPQRLIPFLSGCVTTVTQSGPKRVFLESNIRALLNFKTGQIQGYNWLSKICSILTRQKVFPTSQKLEVRTSILCSVRIWAYKCCPSFCSGVVKQSVKSQKLQFLQNSWT